MPNTPAPLRDALRQAIEALSHEAWVSGWEEGSNDEDVAAARDRVDALLSQIPTDLKAREGDSESSIERQISDLPLPVRNAIIGPNDMRRRLELDLEASEGDDGR